MRQYISFRFVISLFLISLYYSAFAFAQTDASLFRVHDSPPQGWMAKDRSEITAHEIEFDYDMLYNLRARIVNEFILKNADGKRYEVTVQRVIHHNENNWSVTGYLNDQWKNSITISYSEGKILSSINNITGHTFYSLQYDQRTASHIMLSIDPHLTDKISCGVDHDDFLIYEPQQEPNKRQEIHESDGRPTVIDVMVVYTPAARNWAIINSSGIDNVINQAMAIAQQSADNAKTNILFRLVHSALVDYQENRFDTPTDLRRLTSSSTFSLGSQYDGYMEEVHDWRDEYGADLVAMFTFVEDVGGIAWLLGNENGAPQFGFSITRVQQAASSNTHAHEMGHNMGNMHSRNQQSNPAGGGGGVFTYSTGWRWTGEDDRGYVSVMTYNEGDASVNIFSNPDVLHQGVPTGSYDQEGAPADNARSMREMKHVISNYREGESLFLKPTLTINEIRNVTNTSADIEAQITDDGGEDILDRGVCWSTQQNPSQSDDCLSLGAGNYTFSTTINGLNESTTYHVRAFATNETGTAFSENRNFFTSGTGTPELTTKEATSISLSGAITGGNVTDTGTGNVIETGICYAATPLPGFTDTCKTTESPQEDFSIPLEGLFHSTTYYVRAYATNQSGSAFGNEIEFSTAILFPPSLLSTTERTAVSFRANWQSVQEANNYRIDVSSSEDFTNFVSGFQDRNIGSATSFEITGLSPGTTYYYRLRSQIQTGISVFSEVGEVKTVNVSAVNSQAEVTKDRVLATGIQESEVQVTVVDSFLEPVEGVSVALRPSGGTASVVATQGETDAEGVAVFSITNTREETITFTPVAAGLELSSTFSVEFVFADGELALGNNFPNPFRLSTTIPIVIPEPTRVRIDLFNSNGAHIRSIVDQDYSVGYFEVPLNMSGLSSGMYFYRMVTENDVKTEKLMFIH